MHFNPDVDFKLLLATPLIPLTLYVVQIFFGRHLPRKGDWMLTSGMFVSMCITIYLFAKAMTAAAAGEDFIWQSVEHGQAFKWFYDSYESPTTTNMVAGVLYDPMGAAMLLVVGVVAFFVHLFSMGYMQGDRRYHIFFANISLFSFAMLGLVISDNMLFLFIFWEIMGLMSYLLIGHFSHDPTSPRIRFATAACKKAFLTTRVGDVCLLFGMIIFYYHFKTFQFTELWRLGAEEVARNGGEYPAWMTVAGLFVFGGTVGKSAQFPLHIWLPDAMEGPTPVSAMIHAATMVAAGVFLLGRTFPLMSPEVLAVVTVVGSFTALFAATIGTTVYDIKGVLAYSTISQLGFMVAAIGLGGVVAGTFHMVTHAFFKGCLFLCSGSVIHGCHHEQDMRKMGGLRKYMPITFVCMLISTLAIAGIPFFAGFYSKDLIILKAFESTLERFSGPSLFASIALPLAALLTAFYMFRLIFMTFFGEYRGNKEDHGHGHGHDEGHHAHTPHESPWPMTVALVCLAIGGVWGGHVWLADPIHSLAFWHAPHTWYEKLVSIKSAYGGALAVPVLEGHALEHAEHIKHLAHMLALPVSLFVAFGGVALAWAIYGRGWERSQRITGRVTRTLGEAYHAVANKYYIDEMVNATVIKGSMLLAKWLGLFDKYVVDGIVNAVGRIGKAVGFISAWFDKTFVDGLVNSVGLVSQGFGSAVRLIQTGRVQQYATFAVFGGLLAAALLILS